MYTQFTAHAAFDYLFILTSKMLINVICYWYCGFINYLW